MKKCRSSLLFLVSLSFVLMPATAIAAMWDVPVAPGETFRWVFVTSGGTPATSNNIDTYNAFVNATAAAAVVADPTGTTVTGVLGKSNIADIQWRAIGSTSAMDAITNIGPSSAPIYNPEGLLITNGTADMFGDDLNHPIAITEMGGAATHRAWTGSRQDGSGLINCYLGAHSGVARYGVPGVGDPYWITAGDDPTNLLHGLYAISEPLTVVPAPGALLLAATGLLSSTMGLKRLRRKH